MRSIFGHSNIEKDNPKTTKKRLSFDKLFFRIRYFSLLFPTSLKQWEKILVIIFAWVALVCILGLGFQLYFNNSHIVPKDGGNYTEGIVGKPKYINPLLCQTNDADRDICTLIFSGLVKYNSNRQIEGDLAEKWTVDKQKKIYTFYLKDKLTWHDGNKITADDIVFTIGLIQHPDYPGTLKSNWSNVKVEKINDKTVRFKLQDVYSNFLSNVTLGILPKHVWENIESKKLLTAKYNLDPVGSGPFYFEGLQIAEDSGLKTLRLAKFADYKGDLPYLDNLILKFYPTVDKLGFALEKREIDGVFDLKWDKLGGGFKDRVFNHYKLATPQYVAIFFNQQENTALENINVRSALNYSINRKTIIQEVFSGDANLIKSPILSHFPGFKKTYAKDIYNLTKARNFLKQAGFEKAKGDKYFEKDGKELEIDLTTSDQEEFVQIAEIIRQNLEKVGVKLNLHIYTAGILQQEHIRPREYQTLLFGENLGADYDLYPFWHSTQINDPGLNLSLFSNTDLDKNLERARQTNNKSKQTTAYQEIFKIVNREVPAIFIANPVDSYFVNKKIKGIEENIIATSADRFLGIADWYIKGKREWGK